MYPRTLLPVVLALSGFGIFASCSDSSESSVPGSEREEFAAMVRDLVQGSNPYFGQASFFTLQKQLENEALSPQQRFQLTGVFVGELLRRGEYNGAAEKIETLITEQEASDEKQQGYEMLYRMRGLIRFHQAERVNCIARATADSCLFPLHHRGVHKNPEKARAAFADYVKYLELTPATIDDGQSNPNFLAGRWMLNLIAMAAGAYPDDVPDEYRIPQAAFEGSDSGSVGRFVNVAAELGVDTFSLSGGAVIEDMNGDGLLDLVSTTFDMSSPSMLHTNQGDGTFRDRSAASGLDVQPGGANCVTADYDDDGDMDLLILRGAWLEDDGTIRNSLMRNDGDGHFTDVTRTSGLADPARPTQTAVWADFDNDGDLDLYVGAESRREIPGDAVSYPSQYFRNEGNGRFEDDTEKARVANDRYCKGLTVGDFDNDGDMDIYVSNIGDNRLYRNRGNGRFDDVASRAGVADADRFRTFATWFFDYDNDGWLDIFAAVHASKIHDLAAGYLEEEAPITSVALFHNRRDGTFEDVTVQVGLDRPLQVLGANLADIDNDGWLDIYLGTGDPDYEALMPNVLFRNEGGERFVDVTEAAGLGHIHKSSGAAFGDIDNDGDLDLYQQLGGFFLGDKFANALFLNPGNENHWLRVQLVGVESNHFGVGVRIRVVITTPEGSREIHRSVGSVGSFGSSTIRQHIGLGDASMIRNLEITWPTTGEHQVFTNVPLDSSVRVTEGQADFEVLDLQKISLP